MNTEHISFPIQYIGIRKSRPHQVTEEGPQKKANNIHKIVLVYQQTYITDKQKTNYFDFFLLEATIFPLQDK